MNLYEIWHFVFPDLFNILAILCLAWRSSLTEASFDQLRSLIPQSIDYARLELIFIMLLNLFQFREVAFDKLLVKLLVHNCL